MNEHRNDMETDLPVVGAGASEAGNGNGTENGHAHTNGHARKRNRNKGKAGIVAALDIGASKIACLIAKCRGANPPAITGIGLHASSGMRGGEVIDAEALALAVGRAVEQAEHMAGVTIENVHVSLGGGGVHGTTRRHETRIAGKRISDGDIRRVLGMEDRHEDEAETAEGRIAIHRIPVQYRVDGVGGISDPTGMHGETLGVDLTVVSARAGTVRNLGMVVEHNHLKVERFCAGAYASGLAVLVADEKNLGAVVIEMGADVTGLAAFDAGNLVYLDSIPVGGRHVTSDIARGLSTPLDEAERIKNLHGHMLAATGDSEATIPLRQIGETGDDTMRQIEPGLLGEIIRPRIDEVCEVLMRRMHKAGFGAAAGFAPANPRTAITNLAAGGRIIITGGGAQIPAIEDYLAHMLGRPVRQGRPDSTARITGLPEAASGLPYATTAGLVCFAAHAADLEPQRDSAHGNSNGFLWRLGQWFNAHI